MVWHFEYVCSHVCVYSLITFNLYYKILLLCVTSSFPLYVHLSACCYVDVVISVYMFV